MPKTSLRYSDYLPIKLADVSWPGLKDDANQVAFPCVFFVIFHFFGLLKGLLVGHLELKQKGSPIGLQRQVNSPLVVPHLRKQPSYIVYWQARIDKATHLIKCFKPKEPVSDELFKRICDGPLLLTHTLQTRKKT